MNLKTPHPLQTPQRATDQWMADGFGAFLLAVPVLVYGWVFSRYAIGIPKFDDHALRSFLAELHNADTLPEKIYHFFKQHNEHRIVLDRFVAWLDYTFTGKLQYIHLMVLGNLSLVALLFVFVKALRRASLPVWTALPVSLLLFNLSQWENMFWGMAALQNFTVVALAMATFYQLSFGKAVNGWAIGLAVLATLTSGNGLLIWPVGLVLLLLRQDFSGTLRWLVALTITIRLYFLGYEKVTSNPPDQGSVLDLFQGWALFNGSAAQALPVSNSLFICLAAGVILTGVTVVLALVKLLQHFRGQTLAPWSLFFLGSAGFLVGTGLVVAFSRMGFGLEMLLTSRYKIYSLTLMALLFSYALVQTRTLSAGRWLTVPIASVAILVSFLIALFSYSRYLNETVYLRHYLTANQFNWTYTTNQPVSTIDAGTRELMDNEPAFYDAHLAQLFRPLPATPVVPLDTLFYANGEHVARLDSFPVLGLRDEGAYLVARSDRRTYLFPTRQTMASGRRAWLQPDRAFAPGFTAQFLDAELAKGTYDVGLLAVGPDGTFRIYPTGRQIRSLGQTAPTVRKNW